MRYACVFICLSHPSTKPDCDFSSSRSSGKERVSRSSSTPSDRGGAKVDLADGSTSAVSLVQEKESEVEVDSCKSIVDPEVAAAGAEDEAEDKVAEGAKRFAKNPTKGVEYFLENGLIKTNTATDIANFFWEYDRDGVLNRKRIGEYLTEFSQEETLNAFVAQIHLVGLDFDVALRRLIFCVRIPGEAQMIDRLVRAFARSYLEQNSDHPYFSYHDSVATLAFSVLLLNTDAHNPQVRVVSIMGITIVVQHIEAQV